MLIAGLGTLIGLALGASLPFLVEALFSESLPLPLNPTIAPGELALAAAYGLLTAFAFAITPLGRAHDVPVSGCSAIPWIPLVSPPAALPPLAGGLGPAPRRPVGGHVLRQAGGADLHRGLGIAFGLLHLVALA